MKNVLFIFIVFVSRLPVWVIFAGYMMSNIAWWAFLLLTCVIFCARSYKYYIETGSTPQFAGIWTLWHYVYRPAAYILALYIVVFCATYLIVAGDNSDWGIAVCAFGLFILYVAIGFVTKQKKAYVFNSFIKSHLSQVVILMCWVYVTFSHDIIYFKAMALVLIYLLEYLSYQSMNGISGTYKAIKI